MRLINIFILSFYYLLHFVLYSLSYISNEFLVD